MSMARQYGIPDNTAVSDGVHLLVPFAACAAAPCREALRELRLPHLQRLLARLAPVARDDAPAGSFSPPHERALARACGIEPVDGLIPLAAWQVRQQGREPGDDAWAWITPCHWRVGRDHVQMATPQELRLDADDSQALLAAMNPYFAEDGIQLAYEAPLRWLARGEIFRSLTSASLDRVGGRIIDAWMPHGAPGRPLRRLQQEMQMLLYTLPLNEARERGGLLPVNSFWVSGSGALPAGAAPAPPAGLRVPSSLRDAALRQDWPAWREAWRDLDAQECARLAADLAQGRDVRLTLCGEANAHSWSSQPTGLWRKAAALFSRPAPAAALEAL
jgi:hypothetical protein